MTFERFRREPGQPVVQPHSAEQWLAAHRPLELAFGGVLVVLLLACAAYLVLA